MIVELTGFWQFSNMPQELTNPVSLLSFPWKHENLPKRHKNMSLSAKPRGELQKNCRVKGSSIRMSH